ncbi:hypothetical protein [Haladaptatus halobius]|uniref:hypothetical protein n=1 Tax=Haladaptatus halobius TaxID=2884875 RepID=UPI001D0B7261|nr:hypothetical protein [Haladaptatus halobius]
MVEARVYTFLFGRDLRVSAGFLGVGLVIALLFAVLIYTPIGHWLSSTHYFQLLVVVTFSSAAVNAYLNGGVLLSWFLAGSGLLPFTLSFALTDAPLGREPTIIGAINTFLLSVGLYTVVIGSTAFIVGIGARYVYGRLTEPMESLQPVE